MHKPSIHTLLPLFLFLFSPLLTPAKPHNLPIPIPHTQSPSPSPSPPSSPSLLQQPQRQQQQKQQQETQCRDPNTPKSFSFHDITYLRYTTSPNQPSPQPNTTQLVFELVNENTGVSTGCACQIVMDSGTGEWADGDDDGIWYACVDRTITVGSDGDGDGGSSGDGGGVQYPVKTSARIIWDEWSIAVNQTWSCEESMAISQFSTLTLTPTCTETISAFQYIKECTAPDIIVAATSDKNTTL